MNKLGEFVTMHKVTDRKAVGVFRSKTAAV